MGDPPRPPFPFIIGVPRSGTTLLRLMVDAHPQMAIPPESDFPVTLWPFRGRYVRRDGFDLGLLVEDLLTRRPVPRAPFNWDLDPALMRARIAGVAGITYPEAVRRVYALYAETKGKPRYGDKTPSFVAHVPLLAWLFPEGRFVHVIRDGRDVALSQVEKRWGPSSIPEAAALWTYRIGRARRAGRQVGHPRYLEVRYERLVEDTDVVLKEVCHFLDLDFHPAMLEFAEGAADRVPTVERRSHRDLGGPVMGRLRDWRREMEPADAAAFEAVAGRTLSTLGYERAHPSPPASAVAAGLGGWAAFAAGRVARAAGRGISRARWLLGGGATWGAGR